MSDDKKKFKRGYFVRNAIFALNLSLPTGKISRMEVAYVRDIKMVLFGPQTLFLTESEWMKYPNQ